MGSPRCGETKQLVALCHQCTVPPMHSPFGKASKANWKDGFCQPQRLAVSSSPRCLSKALQQLPMATEEQLAGQRAEIVPIHVPSLTDSASQVEKLCIRWSHNTISKCGRIKMNNPEAHALQGIPHLRVAQFLLSLTQWVATKPNVIRISWITGSNPTFFI